MIWVSILVLICCHTHVTHGDELLQIIDPVSSWWTVGKQSSGDVALNFEYKGELGVSIVLTHDGVKSIPFKELTEEATGFIITRLRAGSHHIRLSAVNAKDQVVASDDVELDILEDESDVMAPLEYGGPLQRHLKIAGNIPGDAASNMGIASNNKEDVILYAQDRHGCEGVCHGRPVGKLPVERRQKMDLFEDEFRTKMRARFGGNDTVGWGLSGLTQPNMKAADIPWEGPGKVHFKIIVPMYTVEEFIWKNIRSLRLQRYKNFQAIVVDDCSTDNTASLAIREISDDKRFVFVQRAKRTLALENTVFAIKLSNPKPDDVVVVLDGDDWLFDHNSLGILADHYENTGCWVSYGTFLEFPTAVTPKWIKDFPRWVFQQKGFRSYNWTSTNPRTFKAQLFSLVNDNDLRYPSNSSYFAAAADVAVMMPILEMAGDRISRVPDLLVVYNIANTLNDYKANFPQQIWTAEHVRFLPKYRRLPGSRSPNKPPPIVNITKPSDQSTVPADFVIEAYVDNFFMPEDGSVQLFVNENLIHEFSESSIHIQLRSMAAGEYTITAELVDEKGEATDYFNSVSIIVQEQTEDAQ